nr:hypothetical protein [Tanacetum cinerariifolium]
DKIFKIKDAFKNKQYKPEDTLELFRDLFNDVQSIREELVEYINTPGWNRPAFCSNGDDDDEDYTIAVTSDFLITDSLSMGDEHLDTIPEKESDKFNKSSVKDLVPNPSEFEDFPISKEIISSEFNPIHNEDLDSTPKNDRSNTDSYPLESSLNRDTLISSLKIDSLLAEFAGALIFLESIPPGVDETYCDPEEDIHLVERLSYDNSSPRPPDEFIFENSDAEIESFSPSPIPIEDKNDLSFNPDDPMPPSIEDDDNDSEGDTLSLERLLHDDPIPLPDTLDVDFSNVVRVFLPFFTYPMTSSNLLSSGNEDTIFDPGITIYHFYSF